LLADLIRLFGALIIYGLNCEVGDTLLIVEIYDMVWGLVHSLDYGVKILMAVSNGILNFLEWFRLIIVLTQIRDASACLVILIDLD
jgi:hypothetical protein